MARVRNPQTVSAAFDIDPQKLVDLAVLDATLGFDTRLFIDPTLLSTSRHREISKDGAKQYREHFEKVIKLLAGSKRHGDAPWKAAWVLIRSREISNTALGYGAGSVRGSGIGPELTDHILKVGKEIVDLGVTDPDLFQAMALFEEGIGPDRISDLTTHAILPALIDFNQRVLVELGLTGTEYTHRGRKVRLLSNPVHPGAVILVPTDILRKLPTALD